ncbi:MAG: hypothetical protein HYX48_02100 [Chlamydiales bacterium]|nr:hypothetical protein [Chlamydiales bacterium]
MAGSTTSVGASKVAGASSSEGTCQFDLIVLPRVACTLSIEVIKNRVFPGMKTSDLPRYWSRWTAKTESMVYHTTLHITVPGSATQVKFAVHTEKARNSASHTIYRGEKIPFASSGIEVYEYTCSVNGCQNDIFTHDVTKIEKLVSKSSRNLTIIIGDTSESKAVSVPAKGAVEKKTESKRAS